MTTPVLVVGDAGLIGQHLACYVKNRDYWVPGAGIEYPEDQASAVRSRIERQVGVIVGVSSCR